MCAAVWYKDLQLKHDIPAPTYLPLNIDRGIVFCGFRHGQCIYSKCAITGLKDSESGENEQGFLTSKNRFVGREEAMQIALRQNQVLKTKEAWTNVRLFSEDLY